MYLITFQARRCFSTHPTFVHWQEVNALGNSFVMHAGTVHTMTRPLHFAMQTRVRVFYPDNLRRPQRQLFEPSSPIIARRDLTMVYCAFPSLETSEMI